MSYIAFDKEKLVNINFAKEREILRCSRTGAFASSHKTNSTENDTCWFPASTKTLWSTAWISIWAYTNIKTKSLTQKGTNICKNSPPTACLCMITASGSSTSRNHCFSNATPTG